MLSLHSSTNYDRALRELGFTCDDKLVLTLVEITVSRNSTQGFHRLATQVNASWATSMNNH